MSEVKAKVHTDWQHNWHASLATKITGPILWMIILVSIAVAIVTQKNIRQDLEDTFIDNTDKAAYQLGIYLSKNDRNVDSIRSFLRNYIHTEDFVAMEVDIGTTVINFGEIPEAYIQLERPILVMGNSTHDYSALSLTVYQYSLDNLVRQKRKEALVSIGLPFVLFGIITLSKNDVV